MRRSVVIRKSPDAGTVSIRCGDKVLGTVARIEGGSGQAMAGPFKHTPAFADFAAPFQELARMLADDTGGAEAARIRAEIERLGVVVWHSAHDMRIDQPGTLSIVGGEVRFQASDAFIMMRTGGLG